MESLSFELLCHELLRMQVQLFQRLKAPVAISKEAVDLIRLNASVINPAAQNKPFVPSFLRSCASIFKHVPSSMTVPALEALDLSHNIAKSYVMDGSGTVNEVASVLRAVIELEKAQHHLHHAHLSYKVKPQASAQYNELLHTAYQTAIDKWRENNKKAYTITVISLIHASSLVFAKNYQFLSANAEMTGLLPIKTRVDMEAKLQRCPGARELLIHLRDKEFNRIDAAMSLSTLAEIGFYDEEICNKSFAVLHASQALVPSSQISEVIYSLGILQHRHVHLRFLSGRLDASKCNAKSILRHLQGLAMLQLPPSSPRLLLDGIFLHALRSQSKRAHCNSASSLETGSSGVRQDDEVYRLSPSWYINVAHALACLNIKHHKFMLMTARNTRSSVGSLSTIERCKLLYGIGGVHLKEVPKELQSSWSSKLVPTLSKAVEKVKNFEPAEGLQVMRALQHCGVVDHPGIPILQNIMSTENPAQVIVKTWSSLSKERILDLVERVDPHQLGDMPSSTVASLVHAVACTCKRVEVYETYRLGPLYTALNIHGSGMDTNELIRTIKALHQIGFARRSYETLYSLLSHLKSRQAELTEIQLRDYHTLTEAFKQSEHCRRAD